MRVADLLTSCLSASCLTNKNGHAIVFNTVQQLFLCKDVMITSSVSMKSAIYQLCLKIGKRSRADDIETEAPKGADESTLPSASVARSRVLPGPAVPGFQNCREDDMIMRIFINPQVSCLESGNNGVLERGSVSI